LLHQRSAARHALRIVSQQDAYGIFLLCNLSFQVRDSRVRSIQHLLGLKHVEPGCNAMADSEFSQPDGILLGLDRIPGDLELEVEVEKREIVARHVAHECQDNRLLSILGREELSAGRFGSPPQAAEKIQLERRIRREHEKVGFGLKGILLSVRPVSRALYLRKLAGTRDCKLGPRRVDALHC